MGVKYIIPISIRSVISSLYMLSLILTFLSVVIISLRLQSCTPDGGACDGFEQRAILREQAPLASHQECDDLIALRQTRLDGIEPFAMFLIHL